MIFLDYGSSINSWKPWKWVRFDLILSVRKIYINSNLNPLTKFSSSTRSTVFKDILPWNNSQMIITLSTTNRGKTIAVQMLVSEERKKSKRAGLRLRRWGLWIRTLLSHIEQECQKSLIQGNIHIQQNWNKGLEYL